MHKPLTGVISDSLGFGPESYNTCIDNVRPTHPAQRRNFYGTLERREIPRAFIPRFHAKYKRVDGGCWLWTAGKYPRGYGMVNLGRFADGRQHTEYAHRVAYVLAKGTITDGSVVMHSCDVPACVNPDHLTLGTQGDNVRDAAQKGHYSVPHCRPSRSLKLTTAQVDAIRLSPESGIRLSQRFGVSTTLISLIRRGLRRKAA